MTNAFSRLIAFPFAIALIITFSMGGMDFEGPRTLVVLFCLIALMLIYVFNRELDIWWWKRRMPDLEKPLKKWLAGHSPFYTRLDDITRATFEKRIAAFNHIKNFTLKVEKDFQLEEDVKTIISHEFMRLTLHQTEFLFEQFEHFVVYNHPFGSPDIQLLHTIEVNREEGVVILSKEQLINGFLHPNSYVNIGLLAAIIVYMGQHPRQVYPEVASLDAAAIAEAHGVNLSVIYTATGVERINNLDLLIFCYMLYPNKTEAFDPERFALLEGIFGESRSAQLS